MTTDGITRWGNRPAKSDYRAKFLTGARLIPAVSVAEAYPPLAGQVGKWVSHYRGQHCERVMVKDSVTYIDNVPNVRVERPYPKTGGLIPAGQLVTALAVVPQTKTRLTGRVLATPECIYL